MILPVFKNIRSLNEAFDQKDVGPSTGFRRAQSSSTVHPGISTPATRQT